MKPLLRSNVSTSEDYQRVRLEDREKWHSTSPGGPAFCVGCWWCSGSFEEWATIERQKQGEARTG